MQTWSHNEIWPVYVILSHLVKIFCKNCNLKTSSRPFCVCKKWSKAFNGKWNFWSKLLILAMYSKTIKIFPNQHGDLLWFLSIWDSLKNKKPGTSFQATFFVEFFDKFSFIILHELAKFNYQTVFSLSSYLVK